MALKPISQVTCSLNLGLPYAIDYSYSPKDGVNISITFVNQQGLYQKPQYLQKAYIQLGTANFAMYVVASKTSYSDNRRVIEVTFVDENFQLDKYFVALTGKGCGLNVYQLGVPVDNRTDAQKQAAALDKTAQQIAQFTQFQDIEYTFNDFLTVMRQRFNVQVTAAYDRTVTNSFSGTFREVLNSWCNFFNLSFFFENSIIKIFDPTTLNIVLPTQQSLSVEGILEYEEEEDARDTYGKTVFNWFQQEGGQFSLNQTSSQNGNVLTQTDVLYPAGYEFNLPQPNMDPNQVAAAQYGEPFWFLYNYNLGSVATQCGWTPLGNLTQLANLSIGKSVQAVVGNPYIAAIDQVTQTNRFQAYQGYGANVAGRWYLSSREGQSAIDRTFTWFSEQDGQINNFTDVDNKSIDLTFLTPPSSGEGLNVIEGTAINQFYPGVNYIGNRIVYRDDLLSVTGAFALTPDQQALVDSTYQSLYNIKGSDSMDFNSDLAPIYGTQNTYVAYQPVVIPQDLATLFADIPSKAALLQPRFTNISIIGVRAVDYASLKSAQSSPNDVKIVTDSGPTVVSNTAVIKTLKDGAYTVYYDKYATCASANSANTYFQHRFEPRQISTDNTINFSFSKQANNTYQLNRDYSTINALVNNPLLPTLAQPRSFVTRRITFSTNFFRDIPLNFLTNGLVSMSVSVQGNGVTCSYTFSNEVLQVPYPENQFAKVEQQLKNSTVRHYAPTQVIT